MSRCGPGLIMATATTAAVVLNRAAASITLLQGSGPKPLMRWGSAEPRVSAPSRIPNERPRSADTDHDAISFIPTGYTPARNIPVRNLSGTAAPRPVAKKAIAAVHAAAPSALAASNFCGVTRSARLRTEEVIAPVTNPICTEAVSQTAPVEPRPHSERRVGTTAVAENQTPRPNTSTSATSARCWLVRDSIIIEFRSGGRGLVECEQLVDFGPHCFAQPAQ